MKDPTAAETHRELDDIQLGVLGGRPFPFAGTYMLLRVDERDASLELLRRVLPAIASATDPNSPARDPWVRVTDTT